MIVGKRAFVAAYPVAHAVVEFLILGYQILYAHGRTQYYSPFHHVLGLVLRRLTLEDLVRRLPRARHLFF